jgi:hypothetical protein
VFIGPAGAFKVNAKIDGNIDNIGVEADFGDITKDSDFGGVFGLGCAYNIGSIKLLVNLRGTFGFESTHNPIYDYSHVPKELPPAENIKNRVVSLMIGVGYSFEL